MRQHSVSPRARFGSTTSRTMLRRHSAPDHYWRLGVNWSHRLTDGAHRGTRDRPARHTTPQSTVLTNYSTRWRYLPTYVRTCHTSGLPCSAHRSCSQIKGDIKWCSERTQVIDGIDDCYADYPPRDTRNVGCGPFPSSTSTNSWLDGRPLRRVPDNGTPESIRPALDGSSNPTGRDGPP